MRGPERVVMADDVGVVFSPHNDALVKLFDAHHGHAHEALLFSTAKAIGDDDPARSGRIKATTRTAAEPAISAQSSYEHAIRNSH
jgi:hypothetical protein